ncbi:hypothetical protein, partial [Xanthomonas vasicola]
GELFRVSLKKKSLEKSNESRNSVWKSSDHRADSIAPAGTGKFLGPGRPVISTKFISIVERAGAVLVVGNGLQTCVPLRYKRSVPGPNLKLNTPDNYQFYAMSTANCQPGTAMAGFYTTLGFQGENSATIVFGLSNSGFSYR